MNTMRFIFALALAFSTPLSIEAQNAHHDRTNRQCREAFSERLFSRDFVGLVNVSPAFQMQEIKNYTRYKCLTTEQIKRLASILRSDRDKFEYLEFAYSYIWDFNSYAEAGSVLLNIATRNDFYRFCIREGIPVSETCYPRNNRRNDDDYANRRNDRYPSRNAGNRDRDRYDDRHYDDNDDRRRNDSRYRRTMSANEFSYFIEKIKQGTFDNRKLEIAKAQTINNYLTANQIGEILTLFSFDSNRLEYAKFAYEFAVDKQNYVYVADKLNFESNKRELRKYVENIK